MNALTLSAGRRRDKVVILHSLEPRSISLKRPSRTARALKRIFTMEHIKGALVLAAASMAFVAAALGYKAALAVLLPLGAYPFAKDVCMTLTAAIKATIAKGGNNARI